MTAIRSTILGIVVGSVVLGLVSAPSLSAQVDVSQYGFRYGPPEQAGAGVSGLAGLSSQVAEWVGAGEIVGGEILIIRNDRILLHDVVGWSDVGAGSPLRLNSVYHLASMTKPFTGTAVLMLVDEGRLRLDQPVADLLPSFERPELSQITVRQLLTHTAGWANEGPFRGDWMRRMPDLRTLVDSVAARGPVYPPGEAYRYGDAHSWILGAIVEAVSGMPAEQFIGERILAPLELDDTWMGFAPGADWTHRVNPRYRRGKDGWEKYWDPGVAEAAPFFRAGGGAYSTALDYASWLGAWIDLLEGNAPPARSLMSASSALEAVTPGRTHSEYGLHWFVYGDAPRIFGHGGADGTRAWVVPSEDLIIVYMTQSRGHDTLQEFGALALDVVVPGLRMRALLPETTADALGYDLRSVAREEIEQFLGVYTIDRDEIRVTWENGRPVFEADFWAPYELMAVGDKRYVMVVPETGTEHIVAGPDVQLEFSRSGESEISLRLLRVRDGTLDFEAVQTREKTHQPSWPPCEERGSLP